jgi:hypothetical protein
MAAQVRRVDGHDHVMARPWRDGVTAAGAAVPLHRLVRVLEPDLRLDAEVRVDGACYRIAHATRANVTASAAATRT